MCGFAALGVLLLAGAYGEAHGPAYELQARKLIDQHQLQAALTLLEQARTKEPANTEVLYLRGYVLYCLRDLDKARQQLEEVRRITPDNLHASYFLGRIALLQGHPEAAIALLSKPAHEQPPIEDSAALLGKAYLDTRQLSEALEWTQRASNVAEWEGSLHYRLARIYQQLNQPSAADKEFQRSIQLKVVDAEAIQKLAESSKQIAQGNVAAARIIRESFLQQPQLDPDVLLALGSAFAAAGMPQDGEELLRAAVSRDPSSFQAHFDLGLALLNMGRSEDAITPLEAASRIAPGSVDGNAALGLSYVLANRFQEALPKLELVHSAQPQNTRTEGLLALTYLRTNAPGKAIPLVKASLAKHGDDPKLYFLLMDCLNSSEQQAEALRIADQAVKQFPALPKAHLAKGQQLARLGRYEEAGPSFVQASRLSPSDVEPLLGLAEVQNKAGKYDESKDTYQRVLELQPKNLTAQLGSAKNLVALGRLSEARNLLRGAAVDHADNPQIHLELSRVYLREGSRDDAARETQLVQQLHAQPEPSAGKPQ